MSNNKKFTISLIVLVVLVIAFGLVKGMTSYKENMAREAVSQNVEGEGKCIITIQGGQYDVTEFRTQHGGGDVFKCGEDMTKAFQGKHKGYLPMIEKFKVK